MSMMITSFFPILYHSHGCFQTNIYPLQIFFRHIINTTTIRVLQKFHHHHHGDCRILARWHENMPFGMLLSPHFNFRKEDLDPITLGIASECIYTTFFWTPTSHTLHQLSQDVLFGCFVIALNAAFTQQLSSAD